MAKEKMDEDGLLSLLQKLEDDCSQYTFGTLQQERRDAVRDYYQRPYGNEEDGWSQAVTSDVQDTVEWILPDLLDIFVSSDDAVAFDPTRADEADGAEQATDTCNYVFYKQNNGFLVLHSAFKDALIEKTGIVHWYKQTKRVRETLSYKGVTELELAAKMQDGDKVVNATALPPMPLINPMTHMPLLDPMGQPVMSEQRHDVRVSHVTERKTIKVDCVAPEHLLVQRSWTSPLLDDCPYVARLMEVSLSDLNELADQYGFDQVTAEDLAGSSEPASLSDTTSRVDRTGTAMGDLRRGTEGVDTDDESQTMGWLRIEWVLADFDGDGIAERREVWRLEDKVLRNEEAAQVPVAVGSPNLVPHQWDGKSVAEMVGDLQRIRTDLMRALLNNASMAANPRKTVLTDAAGAPQANIDDLLDYRPGGIARMQRPDALGIDTTPFVASQIFPIMEYVDQMRQQRTGVDNDTSGLDPNSLRADRTAKEVQITANAKRQRIKLIARVLAETLVKPIFKGILKLLTEGDMEAVAFRLRGKFVEYNPNDWRDSYDMTANVGLGTGDRDQKMAILARTGQQQIALAQSPLGKMLVTPKQIYATEAQLLDLTGFKDVDKFWTDPGNAPLPEKPPEPPPWQLQAKDMELKAGAQRFQAESHQEFAKAQLDDQRKQRELDAQNEMQRQNDERDAQREAAKQADETARQAQKDATDAQLAADRLALDRYNADRDRANALLLAKMANPEAALPQGWGIDPLTGELLEKDPLAPVMNGLAEIAARQDALVQQQSAPKIIVRDPQTGAVVGVQHGDQVRPVVRDEQGRVAGLQ